MDNPESWMAVTGTSGRSDGCNKPFWIKEDAVNYVRAYGGYVKPLFFSEGKTSRSVIAMNVISALIANPAVLSANEQSGWGLVNCTEQNLCDLAVRMADCLCDSLNESNSVR